MNTNRTLSVLATAALALQFLLNVAAAETPALTNLQRYIAVDNVCAWPNLTVLPDGSINTTIFGKPSHGQVAGAAECWNSPNGEFWTKRGVPAPNDPHTTRMNVAAGLAKNGDLLVLCSGWTDVKQPQRPKQAAFRDDILRSWVCRSGDGGRTWTQHKEFFAPEKGWTEFIPFGPIVVGEDGALHTSCYAGEWVDPTKSTKTKGYRAWHFRSDDDGKTWKPTSVIGEKHNETSLLRLGGKRWLAAARIDAVELFRSDDDGATWQGPQRVTARNEINAHLARLKDGRLLLTCGSRVKDQFGVLAKLSSDEGKTWSEPIRLAHSLEGDCGYPSSVQRADGRIVTAYYAKRVTNHERYHMGVAIWEPAGK
ncbi:MAG: exo-alpha-sialidase [Verrucomicrobia bacterium]|nr:exo-alpha-sialidase [Verrucomicrobiota bacterium]